jgi:hypothetical protein
MVQRSNYAAVKDAQILLNKEECASGMEQRSNDAAAKDVQVKPSVEEYALSMGQRSRCSIGGCTNYAKSGGVCKRHGAYRNTHSDDKKEETFLE